MLNHLTQGTTLTFQSIFVDDAYANEEWKRVKGYKNYLVSNMGRVKHLAYTSNNKTYKETILAPRKIKGGYIIVRLIKDDNWKDYYVHRLVCEAFCPNPYNFNEVNHKDEDKTNNASINLEWCDHKYNLNYGTVKDKIGRANRNGKFWSRQVAQYKDKVLIAIYPSASEAERQTGICSSSIRKVCLGRPKFRTAGGFKWKEV